MTLPAPPDPAARGLTADEARRRLAEVGPNEPAPARRGGGLRQLLAELANPLVLVLLVAAGISGASGDPVSAGIIIGVVLLSLVLNFFQTYRSQQAADRLRAGVAPTATVLRDGAWRELPRRELVPGDAIRLCAGDLVPADARLLDGRDLHVQQAALTGESLPVEKEAVAGPDTGNKLEDRNRVFLGTSVVSGTATAVVEATGPATAFGDIAARLASRAPETEFDRGTRRFGVFIVETVLVLVLFVFLASVLRQTNPLQSLLFAIALAVGLTPEFLPMITAVTLARGAVVMARNKVIVKHLAALQNFGSMDVLCSDKTGTLTKGEMDLAAQLGPFGEPSDRPGPLAYLNSFHETGIKSPLDAAILRTAAPPDLAECRKLDEVPFDFERRRLSVAVAKGDRRLLLTKGAPEGLLACCTAYEADGSTHPLDDAARARATAAVQALNAQGFRLLAVAYRDLGTCETCRADDERDLVLVGFVSFLDPIKEDAAESLAALRADGVTVKILTGDNELVARHACEQVGLDGARIVLGSELEKMTDAALLHVAEETAVFARVSPAQKNRVILALKARGHVVGFLGDGINDAPSLHAADVGISVATAVDVAKDAAEIILMEPGLGVLHTGIREGRRAFGNVMKYLLMGTSSNFGNMFSMAAATLFLPFLPMLPVQLLLNNFLYDLAQLTIPTDEVDPSFVQKPRRWDIGLIRRFMLFIGPISSIYDFLTFGVLIWVFQANEMLFHTGWFVESLATQTLVLLVIRTAGNPFRSRPSRPLLASVLGVVLLGVLLPYSPLAGYLGFEPLPAGFFLFLVAATATYLALVEVVKRKLMGAFLG